jgi:DNA-binding CsgD family transcriptional regulator
MNGVYDVNQLKEAEHPVLLLVSQLNKLLRKLNLNSDLSQFMKSSVLDLRMFEEMGIGVYMLNYETASYLYVNNAMSKIYGIEKDVFLKSDLRILDQTIHPDDLIHFLQIITKTASLLLKMSFKEKTESKLKVFYRIKLANGSYSWCMQMNQVIHQTNTEKLIDFGTVILMPENQVIHKVVGYLSRGDKTIEINSSAYNSGVLDALTRREKEVLTYVSKGKSSHEIAVLLKLSVQTVKIHRKNILKKLDVNSSIQAIAMMESIK